VSFTAEIAKHGFGDGDIDFFEVPGSLEIPLHALRVMAYALNATLARRSRKRAVLSGSAAAAMASMALWNTYRARKVEQEHPPRGQFVTVDGVRLHYLEKGEGRPVVLLHANVVTAEDFDLSGLRELAGEQQCHVVAFDRPGPF
jgi:hypothetical protein